MITKPHIDALRTLLLELFDELPVGQWHLGGEVRLKERGVGDTFLLWDLLWRLEGQGRAAIRERSPESATTAGDLGGDLLNGEAIARAESQDPGSQANLESALPPGKRKYIEWRSEQKRSPEELISYLYWSRKLWQRRNPEWWKQVRARRERGLEKYRAAQRALRRKRGDRDAMEPTLEDEAR